MSKIFWLMKYVVPFIIGGLTLVGFENTQCCSDNAWGFGFGITIVVAFVMSNLVEILSERKTF